MSKYTFFDRETNTKLSLLQTLYQEEFWCSTKYLVKKLNLDRRTTIKYLKLLQEDSQSLLDYEEPIIQDEKGKGFKFVGNKVDYHHLIYKLIADSTAFSFIQDLYFHRSIQIEDFCETHFVSETSIKKLIRKVNFFFKPHKVKLLIVKGEIYVSGNELAFRYFGYIFFWNTFKGIVWPFEQIISESTVRHFIQKIFSKYSDLTSITLSQWSYVFAINSGRIKNGYILSKEDLPDYAEALNDHIFWNSPKWSEIDEFPQAFYALSAATKTELDFFALITQIGVRAYLVNHVLEDALTFHQQYETPIYAAYQLVKDAFALELTSTTPEIEKIANSLIISTFITTSLFPSFNTTVAGYDYNDYLYHTFPFLTQEMETRLEKMKQHSTSDLVQNNSFLVARLCELYGLIGHPSDFNPKIHIKLETDLPLVMEHVLANQLASMLSPFFNVSFLSPFEKIRNNTPDLIIASTHVQVDIKKEVMITYINPSFNAKDVKLIMEKINTINAIKSSLV